MGLGSFDCPLPLVGHAEVLSQPTIVERKNWERHRVRGADLSAFQADQLTITRQSIMRTFNSGDYGAGVIATLMWGYPKGAIGQTDVGMTTALLASSLIGEALKRLKEEPEASATNVLTTLNQTCTGIGPATTSKLAYFAGIKTTEGGALIYDNMVRRAINALRSDTEFDELRAQISLRKTNIANATYGTYIRAVINCASRRTATADQIEHQLFRLGRISALV